MDGTIPLNINKIAFQSNVWESFRHYWNISFLTQSPLASISLVDACLLSGDERCADARGLAVRAFLNWGLARLASSGNKHDYQSYDVLQKRYIEGLSNTAYADLRSLSDKAAQTRRQSAIRKISHLLWSENHLPTQPEAYRHTTMKVRCEAFWQAKMPTERCCEQSARHHENCSVKLEKQRFLNALATFRHPFSLSMASQLNPSLPTQPYITHLLAANLLTSDKKTSHLQLSNEIGSYLRGQMPLTERHDWHDQVAQLYQREDHVLEAVYHLQKAEKAKTAASLLLEQANISSEEPLIPELQERLASFQKSSLSPEQWIRIKLMTGQMAELSKRLDVALSEYQQALKSDQPTLKAEAYYRLASLHEQQDIDAALIHYTASQRLLAEKLGANDFLLVQVYIRLAWLFIEHRSNREKAQANLRQADSLIKEHSGHEWKHLQSELHTTWATFYARQISPNPQQIFQHCWNAWQYASEVGESELSTNTAFNLGNAYRQLEEYEKARQYFAISKELALQIGNARIAAASNKGIGSCYVSGDAAYDKALPYYLSAYEHFKFTQNRYWQAITCHDLAEAYAHIGKPLSAKAYLDEGITIVEELGNIPLQEALSQIQKIYVELSASLNDQQRQAIAYIRQHRTIKRKAYQELSQTSPRTAARHLGDLVKKGICIKQGKGRATCYELAPAYQR